MEDFRKINIDQYDEDVLLDEELVDPDPRSGQELLALVQGNAQETRSLMARGDAKSALSLILADPPFGRDATEAKNLNLNTLMDILNSTRSTEIAGIVKALSIEEQDHLMAYIYKGLSHPESGNSAILLNWHERLTEAAGTGCIVRVMTDRRDL
ncbi:arp2/3 complex subunit [Tilletiaria anomala UBC 951]|uniref:Actin-related protein 2/3 complex subunit 5 n=1 Tax=Tilletiaria anomala (strain ATCC 24038 / CBS 436.72 / UBC 951) TaxID=1037660 RepID=A0A066VXJ9_TILAU|nr:arp2/3 complex subunit [Tilletiaria anomala UBC 951]KDN43544.1 arp2/3 complex subunit [Tilletiaria anomala UBC 951]